MLATLEFRRDNMIVPMIRCVIIICVMSGVANGITPIPRDWRPMCTQKLDSNILELYVENVTSSGHVIDVFCNVDGSKGDKLLFRTLRDHLRQVRETSLFLQIRCSNGGVVSLPWPMKARGLVGLVVSNCVLTEKYADFGNPDISNTADSLRVLEIRNSAWLSDDSSLDKMTSAEGLASFTSDYDCGQDSTIEYLVNSNVSYVFPATDGGTAAPDAISDTSRNQAAFQDFDHTPIISNHTLNTASENKSNEDAFLKLLDNLQSLNLQCNYAKLKLLDESVPHVLPIQHFALLVQGAKYPELRTMNYSFAGIRKMPPELQDFRKYFPKLQQLDLSWNYLTEVELTASPRGADGRILKLDVRHNLITGISVDKLTAWSEAEDVILDIRDNPLRCGCEMQHAVQVIQSGTFFVGKLARYSYIQEMRCADPLEVRGQRLSEVILSCGGDNHVLDAPPASTRGIGATLDIVVGCTVAAVIILIAALLVLVLINLRLGSELFKKCFSDFSKTAPETVVEAGKVDFKTKDLI